MNPIDSLLGLIVSIPATFWSDIAKTLIGTLVGAGLAFKYALRRDSLSRIHEQRAAGNFAMAILARQLSDFAVTKVGIEQHRSWVLKEQPQTPLWMQLKPIQIVYAGSLSFDLKSLVFLFKRGRGHILERLITAELAYVDFTKLVEVHRVTSEEVQRNLSDANIDFNALLPTNHLESVVGTALIVKLRDVTAALFERMEKGDAVYVDAARSLHQILVEEFGKDEVIKIERKRQEELKPISPPKMAG